LGTHDK
jgi:hypothetical protein